MDGYTLSETEKIHRIEHIIEAMKINPWQRFMINVVLLFLSILMFFLIIHRRNTPSNDKRKLKHKLTARTHEDNHNTGGHATGRTNTQILDQDGKRKKIEEETLFIF